MLRRLRNEPRAALLLLALVMANLLAWGWAWNAFSSSSALMAASLLAGAMGCVTRWMLTTSRPLIP